GWGYSSRTTHRRAPSFPQCYQSEVFRLLTCRPKLRRQTSSQKFKQHQALQMFNGIGVTSSLTT
ncbi:unnamed protein product, partial [Ceratitis capitata]